MAEFPSITVSTVFQRSRRVSSGVLRSGSDKSKSAHCASSPAWESVTSSTKGRRALFGLITFLFVILLSLGIAEVGARALGLRVANDPFIHFGRVPSYFSRVDYHNEPHLKVTNAEIARSREIVFPVLKTQKTFRVFCLGSSASAGWPHPSTEAYSAYLEHALQESFPERKVEVINVSAVAYALYRTRMIFEQIMEFQPDLVILYAGNNEFVENRRYQEHASKWLTPLLAASAKSVVYRMMRGGWVGTLLSARDTLASDSRQSVAYSEWSKIERMSLRLRAEPTQFQRVKDHYAFCAEDIVKTAGQRGVPVMLMTVPVNLREWPPNVSVHKASGAELASWESAYRTGRAALLDGRPRTAVDSLSLAAKIDDEHALSHYYLAQALDAVENHEQAALHYDRARDLDYNPFRALSDFNEILRGVARRNSNAILVDADAAFRESSAPLAPGFDLFIDYVHPNKAGNLILARLVHESIVHSDLLHAAPKHHEFDVRTSNYDETEDLELQFALLQLFEIMRQDALVVQKAQSLASRISEINVDWKVRAIRHALAVFPSVLEQEQAELLGKKVSSVDRELAARQLRAFYQQNFLGYRQFQKERQLENERH